MTVEKPFRPLPFEELEYYRVRRIPKTFFNLDIKEGDALRFDGWGYGRYNDAWVFFFYGEDGRSRRFNISDLDFERTNWAEYFEVIPESEYWVMNKDQQPRPLPLELSHTYRVREISDKFFEYHIQVGEELEFADWAYGKLNEAWKFTFRRSNGELPHICIRDKDFETVDWRKLFERI